jgi:predicted ATP-grasp superfamily ATP-dependent carboligase
MRKIEDINFNSPPIMFAAWPGMGNVALMAMDYLRRTVDARLFAELDMEPFYVPEEVVVSEGIASFPELPRSFFHEQHEPNLVFFESTIQTEGQDAVTIAQMVLEVAKKLKAPRIYTAAALPLAMSYKAESEIYVAANQRYFLNELESYGIKPLNEGYISGLSGLLLGIAASQNIEAACIMATIPTYAAAMAYPKGSLAIVKCLARINDLDIDTSELENGVAESEESFAEIEERLRNVLPMLLEQDSQDLFEEQQMPPPSEMKDDKVPEYVMARIERLFRELAQKKDKARALELKAELDKWGLYEIYEKRFLNLFKKP